MMRVDDFGEMTAHRPELMALWRAETAHPDSDHDLTREALLRVTLQFHDRHPEHSVTSLRKALIAWLGLQPSDLTGNPAKQGQGPLTTLVKISADDGSLRIYVASAEHRARRPGVSRVDRVISNGRPVAAKAASSADSWVRMPGGQPITEPLVIRRYDDIPVLKP